MEKRKNFSEEKLQRFVDKQLKSKLSDIEEIGRLFDPRHPVPSQEKSPPRLDGFEDLIIEAIDSQESSAKISPASDFILNAYVEYINKTDRKPSQLKIAKKLGIGRKVVRRHIERIQKTGIDWDTIDIEKSRSSIKWKKIQKNLRSRLDGVGVFDLMNKLTISEVIYYSLFLDFAWADSKIAKKRKKSAGLSEDFVNGAVATIVFLLCSDNIKRLRAIFRTLAILLFDKGKILSADYYGSKEIKELLDPGSPEGFGFALVERAAEFMEEQSALFDLYMNECLKSGVWEHYGNFQSYFHGKFKKWIGAKAGVGVSLDTFSEDFERNE
jgi:hypothetical protein